MLSVIKSLNLGHLNHSYPVIKTNGSVWYYIAAIRQNDANRMANRINPDQTLIRSLIWVFTVCADLSQYVEYLRLYKEVSLTSQAHTFWTIRIYHRSPILT